MTAGTAFDTILDGLRALEDRPRALVADEAGVVDPWRDEPAAPGDLRGRRFTVFGRTMALQRPIDWLQDPYESRSWRYQLHTLTWLRPAVERHAIGLDPDALAAAQDVVLDWVEQHVGEPAARSETSEFAWYDMAVGLRAPYLAYVLRAGLREGTLDDDEARLLLHAVERHGEELVDSANYAAGNNHGLYQDEGLYLLTRQLPSLPLAREWTDLAVARLLQTLRATVSFDEGAHLEHSTAYQFAIVNLVARLVAAAADDLPELTDLLDRMRRTATWQVTPAGRLLQFGDTDDEPAPRWAQDTAAHLRGLNPLFQAGQAFVRDGDSYLAVAAAYHGPAHKQADDTGFVLVERGRVLLGDAGRWGYYEREPDRLYARSAAAHNVLTIDGRETDWTRVAPYGSGLVAAGEGDGWYAILVSNRLLEARGVAHRRLFLYRPGDALIVADDVRSHEPHDYTRRFHFGPGLDVDLRDGAFAISGVRTAATLTDLTPDNDSPSIGFARGRDDPDRLGWTYPADRKRGPVWTAELGARASNATFAAALSVTGRTITVKSVSFDGSGVVVDLGDGRVVVEVRGREAVVLGDG